MLKLEILASLAVLMCGQILLWRRRDNVFGYQQVGLFVSSALIPILGTTVLDDAEPAVVHRYASILAVGAAGYLVGLMYGASIGFRWRLPRVSFSSPFTTMPPVLVRRIRLAALASGAALVASYLLLGYVPLLAADRQSAKYGVGAYQTGFARGAAVYHLALALAGAAIAVLLALVAIRRRPRDMLLLAVIGIGLALTLSRGQALTGPLVFLMAWGIQRRWRPWKILALACTAFLASAFVNQIVFIPAPTANSSFASDVAASAPDVTDHLGFLHGFEVSGSQQIGLKTILAGASPSKGEWDPGDYALRMRTGLPDVSQLASGGIRLPVPVWGYASYGFVGAAIFSFLAGLFTGWGTTLVRRMLTGAQRTKHQALNLVLAWIFFNGTFDVLAGFSFLERSNVAVTVLAIGLCLGRRLRPRPEPSAETRTGAPYSVLGSAGGAPVS